MALKYDYDIHWQVPRELRDDPKISAFLHDLGAQHESRANYVALFRSPATVEALRHADPAMQAYFRVSGFGLSVYDSGAPDGLFPAEDLTARTDITERLTANLTRFTFNCYDSEGFDLSAFLDYEMAARPIDMAALAEARAHPTEAAHNGRGPGLKLPGLGLGFGAMLRDKLPARASLRLPLVNPLALGATVLILMLAPYVSQGMGLF